MCVRPGQGLSVGKSPRMLPCSDLEDVNQAKKNCEEESATWLKKFCNVGRGGVLEKINGLIRP